MPNKLPPDLVNESDQQQQRVAQLNLKKPRDRLSSNLIDLNSPPPDQASTKINLNAFDPIRDNLGIVQSQHTQHQPPDVFDIRTFNVNMNCNC